MSKELLLNKLGARSPATVKIQNALKQDSFKLNRVATSMNSGFMHI